MASREICTICQETLRQPAVELHTCKHRFHEDCVTQLIENDIFNCPNCVRPFKKGDIEPADDLSVRKAVAIPKSAESLYKILKDRLLLYIDNDGQVDYDILPGYNTLPKPEQVKLRSMLTTGARRRTHKRKTRRNKIRKS